ncbi:uncharacterized protein LOC116001227 [Ipomoea triloba]|uniref:uncharacterized protein LOC116001227 n=1 Tax=Ipomoea triloba TaxID=35885 RepID=UPI00125D82AA|nr:uncharacterized protein LOC116001227 [Ipomoea triloba]
MGQAVDMVAKLWTIWLVRNDTFWNAKTWHIDEVKCYAQSLVSAWQHTYSPTVSLFHNTQPALHTDSSNVWCPPPEGMLKCNVDAALLDDNLGFGVVARDHAGKFVAAYSGHLHYFRDPYLAETMVVKEALTWLKNRSNSNVIVESMGLKDPYLNFCNSFNSNSQDFSYVGLLIKQCRFIASDIRNIVVRHVKQSANHVTHVLARVTGSPSILGVWDCFPALVCVQAMENSSSSSNSRCENFVFSEKLTMEHCHCGRQLKLLTSWTNENPS